MIAKSIMQSSTEERKNGMPQKMKRVPVAEQYSNLQDACRTVKTLLKRKGVDIPETTIETFGTGLHDEKTNAMVINAHAPVAFLLTHFSGLSHWFQRKTFHHTRDEIYQRLIIAILQG